MVIPSPTGADCTGTAVQVLPRQTLALLPSVVQKDFDAQPIAVGEFAIWGR